MSTDVIPIGEDRKDADPPYHLASAEVGGVERVLVVSGTESFLLDDLLPTGENAPAELHELLSDWATWHPMLTQAATRVGGGAMAVTPDRWLLPVRPSKLVCIGVNYHDHLREMGGSHAPELPYSFLKPASNGIVPSGASVNLPASSNMVDWEAELAVVIGKTPDLDSAEPLIDCVAAYTILNDLSARDWIGSAPAVGIDWVMMKGYDGFSPVGPYLTPREFVTDPQDLRIRCWVNGEIKQDSNTSQMVFGVEAILEHLARIMTLQPGDVVATGTPAGVGFGQKPQQFLKHGDSVTVEIDGLGRLETHMVDQFEGEPA